MLSVLFVCLIAAANIVRKSNSNLSNDFQGNGAFFPYPSKIQYNANKLLFAVQTPNTQTHEIITSGKKEQIYCCIRSNWCACAFRCQLSLLLLLLYCIENVHKPRVEFVAFLFHFLAFTRYQKRYKIHFDFRFLIFDCILCGCVLQLSLIGIYVIRINI